MTTIADWHARALSATGQVVAAIPPDRWQAGTPCSEWTVRALVNHLVSGNLWAAELGTGATVEEVGQRLDGDVLGSDPAAAYAASAGLAVAAFSRPGGLQDNCAVSYGPVTGAVYAGHRFIDVLVHGWDLAIATGQDPAIDADLVDACQQIAEPQIDPLRASGAFGPGLAVPAGASAQTRLLAMLGRADS
jgi:uncharacterized protein (TIGR03086 family)